jgi:hypothetical protein
VEGAIPIGFRPRAEPLVPTAAAARGDTARALAERLLARDDDALARLAGVAGDDLLVVIGARDELPWIDGVVYLGKDPAAPSLLLPTALAPDVPAGLFERAILAHVKGAVPPIAVLCDPPVIAGTGAARPIRRRELLRFARGAAT